MSLDDIVGFIGAAIALTGCLAALVFTVLVHRAVRAGDDDTGVRLSRNVRAGAWVAASGGVLLFFSMILGLLE